MRPEADFCGLYKKDIIEVSATCGDADVRIESSPPAPSRSRKPARKGDIRCLTNRDTPATCGGNGLKP